LGTTAISWVSHGISKAEQQGVEPQSIRSIPTKVSGSWEMLNWSSDIVILQTCILSSQYIKLDSALVLLSLLSLVYMPMSDQADLGARSNGQAIRLRLS